jgi:recombinational DNA repair ATPase RecF
MSPGKATGDLAMIEEPSFRSTDGLWESMEARLGDSDLTSIQRQIVRAAFDGREPLELLLEQGEIADVARTRVTSSPRGAYITSLEVEGFRGIGPRARLELSPGPGLTLVIGRNGSGKSSFAEALEVLFTGDNPRWVKRSAVWREGWKNLHQADSTEIQATLAVEGVVGATTVTRTWPEQAGLDDSVVAVQPHGQPRTDLGFLGWDDALPMFRPFLSYSELGSLLDEGPTKLHDAVSAVLGLDELTDAEKTLRSHRLDRERALKEVLARRDQLVEALEGQDDHRVTQSVAAMGRGKYPDLNALERIATGSASDSGDSELARLRRVLAVDPPDLNRVVGIAAKLREAKEGVDDIRGTAEAELLESADLLDAALGYVERFPTEDCPVCSTPAAVAGDWATRARARIAEQRRIAHLAQRERTRLQKTLEIARSVPGPVPSAVQDVRGLLDIDTVIEAWRPWVALCDELDPLRLADGLEATVERVCVELIALQERARSEIERREDAWRPIATILAGWVSEARRAFAANERVGDLKTAEGWLKKAAVEIRNDRFAPIADEAMSIWKLLRQRSNVELGRIELAGSGTQRKVTLDVTVDGVPGAALGIMSQGELHALALSLFFPRATLDTSPFRFVVVDDPVQSMDPAKVDGLARVLDQAAKSRQVVVFTHDDRLPEAVRRLGIDATILEVSRREGSVVELRPALTPVERHVEDARAILHTESLPDEVARRVAPGFCRLALEAACVEAIRRRRIGRGEAHAEVETLLGSLTRLQQFASLALFDSPDRGGDVRASIENRFGAAKAHAFAGANRGAHEGYDGDLHALVRDSAILSRDLVEMS